MSHVARIQFAPVRVSARDADFAVEGGKAGGEGGVYLQEGEGKSAGAAVDPNVRGPFQHMYMSVEDRSDCLEERIVTVRDA